MKVCKYCNSLANDYERKCKSCGASDFDYKCENCGTVSSTRFCPACGMKIGAKIVTCPVCKTRYGTPVCPCCGYPVSRQGERAAEETEKKTTIWTVLLWIFFLPVMLLITVWKSRKLAVVWKVLITLAVLAIQVMPNFYAATAGQSEKAASTPSAEASAGASDTAGQHLAQGLAYEITYQQGMAYQDQGGMVFLQGIVEIRNTGSENLSFSGTMDFEDAEGNLLAAEKAVGAYPDILLPGEKGYLYCQKNYDGEMPAQVNLLARPKIKAAVDPSVRLIPSQVRVRNKTYGGVIVLGRVENITDETQTMVHIAAILYDANKLPIAVIDEFLPEEIAEGEYIGFEAQSFFLPQDITAESASDILVYAYPAWSIDDWKQ